MIVRRSVDHYCRFFRLDGFRRLGVFRSGWGGWRIGRIRSHSKKNLRNGPWNAANSKVETTSFPEEEKGRKCLVFRGVTDLCIDGMEMLYSGDGE